MLFYECFWQCLCHMIFFREYALLGHLPPLQVKLSWFFLLHSGNQKWQWKISCSHLNGHWWFHQFFDDFQFSNILNAHGDFPVSISYVWFQARAWRFANLPASLGPGCTRSDPRRRSSCCAALWAFWRPKERRSLARRKWRGHRWVPRFLPQWEEPMVNM